VHEHQYTLMIISRSFLHTIKTVSDKRCRENQNTFYLQKFYFENRTVYEIMWKNMVVPDRPSMIT